jgi:hypothetical protein
MARKEIASSGALREKIDRAATCGEEVRRANARDV